MKKIILILCIAALLCITSLATPSVAVVNDKTNQASDIHLLNLQVPFVENQGKYPDSVKFYADTFYGTAFITNTDLTHAVAVTKDNVAAGVVLKEEFVTAGGTVLSLTPQGEDPAETKISYFIGNDPGNWQTGLSTYNFISLGELYPGITASVKAHGNNVEKFFSIAPGADPNNIQIKVLGANSISITDDGSLAIATDDGEVTMAAPKAFQDGESVTVAYRVLDDSIYGFSVGNYDQSKTLVIDPSLAYSTYLGGSGADSGWNVAVDSSGNAYVTGTTASTNFPNTTGAYQRTLGSSGKNDVFVTKLNSDGSDIVYSTYLGGNNVDNSRGIVVDNSGNAYISGYTTSSNYPTTTGAYQTNYGNAQDAFVTKLSPDGSYLIYSTYLGGTGKDTGYHITVDGAGNTYVTGYTTANFPTTTGAYQTNYSGGTQDAFVTKLSPDGSGLIYSTYLGGNDADQGYGIAVDNSGDAYIAGYTTSTNIPTTTGSYQGVFGGDNDAFVTKLNPDGSSLIYSTYLGGSGGDPGSDIAVDSSGNTYISGHTTSANFPTTAGAYQITYGGAQDVFFSKLNPTGSGLIYSTYLGGSGEEYNRGVAVDSSGGVYLTGSTASTNFPTTTDSYQGTFGGGVDAFFSKLNPLGNGTSDMFYSTYLGGSGSDSGNGVALDGSGNAYISGSAGSSGFPTTTGAYSTIYGGGTGDAIAVKFSGLSGPTSPILTTINITPETITLEPGDTQQFTTTAKDEDGNEMTGITFTWSSSNETTGMVNSTGFFTALAEGTTNVTASAEGVNGTVQATVNAPSIPPSSPVANFKATPTYGSAPLTVNFTDQSIGNVSSYSWDFNSNGTVDSTEQNPSYTYTSAGKYTVNLTVSNAEGSDSEVKTEFITVTATGKTWYVDDSGGADFTDIQTAVNSAASGDTIFVYGGIYNGFYVNNPYISIIGEGADVVTVGSSIFLPQGTSTSQNAKGTVLNGLKITAAPKIKPSTQYGNVSDLIIRNCAFEGITSSNAIEVRAYNTTFENNTMSNCTGSNVLVLVGTMKGNSTKITNNTFKNNSNAAAIAFSKTENNTVKNNLIEANNIGFLFSNVYEGNKIYLNSLINNSQITKVSGTVSSISWSSPDQIPYTYNDMDYTGYMGNYWSNYTGTDSNGDGIGDTPYDVPDSLGADNYPLMQSLENYFIGSSGPVAPVAAFNGTPLSGMAPLAANFTDLSTGSPTSWQWDFGDGYNTTGQNVSHTYNTAGNYTVNLTVSNTAGNDSEIKTDYIVVNEYIPVLPVANFTADPTSGTTPLTVQFNDSSTGNVTSWLWDFGDGTTNINQNPSHTYNATGLYNVSLNVTGEGGSNSTEKTNYINVNVPAPTNDLSITGLVNTVPASAVFAKETNTVTVASIKNAGPPLTNVSVAIYASDISGGTVPVNTTTITSIANNGTVAYVSMIDPTIRNLEGGTVTYTAVVDPNNLIPETNETNNNKSSYAKLLRYNGLKGKGLYWEGGSNITTKNTYDLQGNLLYSTQLGSAYKSVGWTDRTETWAASDLPVPSGSTIEKAFLYVTYNLDSTPGGYPWWNVTFNGNILDNGNISTGNGTLYTDTGNFGESTEKYGLYAYDVTDKFNPSENSLVMTPTSDENRNDLYPSTLVVIYRHPNETRKQIFINEECDVLGLSASLYGTTPEEATAYAPFTGMPVDVSKITNATLYSFAGNAGPDEGDLLFNGNTVETNAWMNNNAFSVSPLVFNATNYISTTGNEAGIRETTNGEIMAAFEQILVIEYQNQTAAPVANFTADPTSGAAPLTVQFTDTSTGNISSYAWDFNNDGIIENNTTQSPSHTYASAGTYTVNLTVTGSDGSDSEVKTEYINVSTPVPAKPVANFTADPTLGIMPLNVQFTDLSTGVPTSWSWTFGDGNTSTEKNPSHVYSKVGKFTVKLTVKNALGSNSTTKTSYIDVKVAPLAEFSANKTVGKLPMAVKFTDKSTGTPIVWFWDFGDGNTSTEKTPVHVYGAVGRYNVTLTATNAVGNNTITKYSYIDVEVVPLANFSADPTVGIMPLSVSFADLSTGAPTSWKWNFGDGTNSTEQNPSHIYSKVGKFTVSLTAKNPVGSNTSKRIKYINVEVVPVADFKANKTVGKMPMSVKFTDKSTGDPTSWLWDFGDGNTSTDETPVHLYGAVGKYDVTLTATNAVGNNTITKSSYIDVEVVPVANFTADPTVGANPLNVSFTDLSTGAPTSWTWTFGDGSSSTEQNPSHEYTEGGQFTVKLTAKNPVGSNSITKTKYIAVESVPVASFSATPTSGAAPLSVSFTDKSTGFPENWNWSFGDGNTSTEKNPVNVYSSAGQYNVSLTVTNLMGTSTKTLVKYIKIS